MNIRWHDRLGLALLIALLIVSLTPKATEALDLLWWTRGRCWTPGCNHTTDHGYPPAGGDSDDPPPPSGDDGGGEGPPHDSPPDDGQRGSDMANDIERGEW